MVANDIEPGAITAATNNPTNFDSNTRTEGTYLIAATGGSGIGAVFEVKVAADGTGTVTLKQKGSGYTAGNTLTIPKTGGYWGAKPRLVGGLGGEAFQRASN